VRDFMKEMVRKKLGFASGKRVNDFDASNDAIALGDSAADLPSQRKIVT